MTAERGANFGFEEYQTNLVHFEADIGDEDDGHVSGIDFEIPYTAETHEPFRTQNGSEFTQTQNLNRQPESQVQPYGEAMMEHFTGDNFVQVPIQVNVLNIQFAKTSKHIDVRRLKKIIWNLLQTINQKVY